MNESFSTAQRITAALSAALSFAPGAFAQSSAAAAPSPLAQGLFGAPANDAGATAYTTPDGVRFVLDMSGSMPRVKFDGETAVLTLTAVPGPRGDEILKGPGGEVVLRITSLGGVTVFRDAARLGAPAARIGPAASLQPMMLKPQPPTVNVGLSTTQRR
jgi:hypothetical protein